MGQLAARAIWFGANKDAFAAQKAMTHRVRAAADKFAERKSGIADAIANVAAVVADVVVLAEMQISFSGGGDFRCLVGPIPTFHYGHRYNEPSTWHEHAIQFGESFPVVDMFKDVAGDEHIDGGIGKGNIFDVENEFRTVGSNVGSLIIDPDLPDEIC